MELIFDYYSARGIFLIILGIIFVVNNRKIDRPISKILRVKLSKGTRVVLENYFYLFGILYIFGGVFLLLRRVIINFLVS